MEFDTQMIVLILVAIIQVILILSVVHISGKTDEIAKTLKEISDKLNSEDKQKKNPARCANTEQDNLKICNSNLNSV